MNGSLRFRRRTAAACFALVVALCALVVVPVSSAGKPEKPGKNYLALGDSLAYGYQAAKFYSQYPNVDESTFDTGYVDVLAAKLGHKKKSLDVTNYGCPGETSDSFIRGGRGPLTGFTFMPNPGFCGDQPAPGVGAIFSKSWLHDSYLGSQLDAALAYLAKKNHHANPITLDIGANDTLVFLEQCGFGAVVGCINPTSIGALYAHIAANVAVIVRALRETAPDAEIIVLGLYNPYPTVLQGGDMVTKALNTTLNSVVTGLGARFADPLPVFNPASVSGGSETADFGPICLFTNMCPGGIFNPASPLADIHPTDAGYETLAGIVNDASSFDTKHPH